MAISWYIVRICTISQEIATAFGLAMTVVMGRWSGFAGVRWDVRCILRNGTGAVPYRANFTPLRAGATLAVVPSPTIHGGGRPQADRPTVTAVPQPQNNRKISP